MPTGWVEQTQAEWNQIRGCGRRVHQEGMSTLHTMSKHHMPPVRSFGTTLSGLFLYPQSTHGSTSAVQPWALWQNPVGIPGGASDCLLLIVRAATAQKRSDQLRTVNHQRGTNNHPILPPGTPKWVLPCSPGLRGSPRYPGCAWQSPNNHNVVVPRRRAGTLPRTGPLPKLTPRRKTVNAFAPLREPRSGECHYVISQSH